MQIKMKNMQVSQKDTKKSVDAGINKKKKEKGDRDIGW